MVDPLVVSGRADIVAEGVVAATGSGAGRGSRTVALARAVIHELLWRQVRFNRAVERAVVDPSAVVGLRRLADVRGWQSAARDGHDGGWRARATGAAKGLALGSGPAARWAPVLDHLSNWNHALVDAVTAQPGAVRRLPSALDALRDGLELAAGGGTTGGAGTTAVMTAALAAQVSFAAHMVEVIPIETQPGTQERGVFVLEPPEFSVKRPLPADESTLFCDFLLFEKSVFGDEGIIGGYDPYLIRYGEYRYALDLLRPGPGDTILDLGCEFNILMLYAAARGASIIAVDIDPRVGHRIDERREIVEQALGRALDIRFHVGDGTRLDLPRASVDKVMAISSIEHMFSDAGDGDRLAVEGLGRVLRPGGTAVVTVPMSNRTGFHEVPGGDPRFDYSYRLYTPEKVRERYVDVAGLELLDWSYLAQTTPDPRWTDLQFQAFWINQLTEHDRAKWAWIAPVMAKVFNPRITKDEGEEHELSINTALLHLRRKREEQCS